MSTGEDSGVLGSWEFLGMYDKGSLFPQWLK